MFKNTRTGASASELRGYNTEDEMDAKIRLEAAGWKFDVDYEWDDDRKLFSLKKEMEEEVKEDD